MATKRTELDIRSKGGDKVERDLKKIGATGEATGRKISKGGAQASKGLKAVDAAVARTSSSMRRLADRLGPVGAALNKLGPAGLAAAGGAVAAGGLLILVKRAAESADALAKQARAADISVESLQEYRFAASLASLETDKLDGSLVKFNKRVGDLTTSGTGPLVNFLQKFDQSLLDNIKNARSQEEALDLVFRRMASLESQAERTALADAAFSETGRTMTLILGDNAEALDKTRQRARDLGLVISTELTDDAERMNDRLSEMSQILGTNIDKALLTLAPAVESVGISFANAAPGIAKFVEGLLPLESLSLGSLAEKVGKLRKQLADARDRQINAEADPGLFGIRKKEADREVESLERQVKAADALLAQRVEQSVTEKKIAAERREQAEKDAAARKKVAESEASAQKAEKARLSERKKALSDIAKLEEKASKAGLTGVALLEKERDDELARQVQRLEKNIINEEEFARARLAIEKDFNAQRVELEQKAQEKIDTKRSKAAEKAAEELQKPFDNAAENIQRAFGDKFTEIFRNGKASFDDLGDVIKGIMARTAGEIAALLVFRPQVLAAGGGLAGLFGAGPASAAGAGGLGNNLLTAGIGKAATSFGGFGGAFLGAGLGAYQGYQNNGTRGAVIGGLAGYAGGAALTAGGAALASGVGVAGSIGAAGLGITSALAAIPVWGWAALAALAVFGGGKSKSKIRIGSVANRDKALELGFNNIAETPFGVVGVTADSNKFGGGRGKGVTSAAKAIDEAIASLLSDAEIERVRAALDGATTRRISRTTFDKGDAASLVRERLADIIDAIAENDVASQQLSKTKDIGKLTEEAALLVTRIKSISDLLSAAEPLNAAEQALKALNAQFDQLAGEADKLGFSVDRVEQKRQDAIKQLTTDANEGVRLAILSFTDPLAASLEALEAGQQRRLEEFKSLGADIVEAERLFGLERKRLIEQQTGSFTQANGSITAFLDSLQTSAAGGLTVADRAANADTQFNALLSAARGDAGARTDLASFLPGFVDLKRQQLGSTESFFEFRSFLETSLRNLVNTGETVSTLNDIGDAITTGNNAIVLTLQEEIGSLKSEVSDLNEKLSLVLNA